MGAVGPNQLMSTMDARVVEKYMLTAAHLLCLVILILISVWAGHYMSGGVGLGWNDSASGYKADFNAHPVMMVSGLVVCYTEAILSYRSLPFDHLTNKWIHFGLHSCAMIFLAIGLRAVFKFHDENKITNMYSAHSWVGMTAVVLYSLQYVCGAYFFLLHVVTKGDAGVSESGRQAYKPVHAWAGLWVYGMSLSAVLMGILEKLTFTKAGAGTVCNDNGTMHAECKVANVLCLFIFFLGGAVLSVVMMGSSEAFKTGAVQGLGEDASARQETLDSGTMLADEEGELLKGE